MKKKEQADAKIESDPGVSSAGSKPKFGGGGGFGTAGKGVSSGFGNKEISGVFSKFKKSTPFGTSTDICAATKECPTSIPAEMGTCTKEGSKPTNSIQTQQALMSATNTTMLESSQDAADAVQKDCLVQKVEAEQVFENGDDHTVNKNNLTPISRDDENVPAEVENSSDNDTEERELERANSSKKYDQLAKGKPLTEEKLNDLLKKLSVTNLSENVMKR